MLQSTGMKTALYQPSIQVGLLKNSVYPAYSFADEVYRHQPNLLASVLALHGSEVSMPELDEMLNILFVCYQAMIETGKTWPEITLQDQEKH